MYYLDITSPKVPFHDLTALYLYDFRTYVNEPAVFDRGFSIRFTLLIPESNCWATHFASFIAAVCLEVESLVDDYPCGLGAAELQHIAYKCGPHDELIIGFLQFQCLGVLELYQTILKSTEALIHPRLGAVHYKTAEYTLLTTTEKEDWMILMNDVVR